SKTNVTYGTNGTDATDNCPGVTSSCAPASGSTFAKGTTTVNCTATDASGNTASCSFTVTIHDTENPSITCPANITASTAAGSCSKTNVTYGTNGTNGMNATDNCPGVTSSCAPPSGTTFSKG